MIEHIRPIPYVPVCTCLSRSSVLVQALAMLRAKAPSADRDRSGSSLPPRRHDRHSSTRERNRLGSFLSALAASRRLAASSGKPAFQSIIASWSSAVPPAPSLTAFSVFSKASRMSPSVR